MKAFTGKLCLIFIFCSLLFSIDSRGESPTKKQIEELKRKIEEIQIQSQREIEELREKIKDLEVQKESEQKKIEELTTKKEEEEKEAWWKKIEVEYKKPGDGFTLKTKDGNFSLKTKLRTQFQFSVNDTDNKDTATSFDIRRFRIYFEGNAFRPWLLYHFQLTGEGNVSLRDAYFDAAYKMAYGQVFVPRLGQYKVPFNREELNSSSELQLVERSIVNEEFTFARDRGIGVYGVLGNYLTYGIGVFNGDGRNKSSVDSNLLYVGRLQFGCCGELKYSGASFPSGGDFKIEPNYFGERKPILTLGVAALVLPGLNIDRKTPDNEIADRFAEIGTKEADIFGFTADANFRYWLFSIEGEYNFRRINPDEVALQSVSDNGFRVQSGLFVVPDFVEVAGRFAYIDFDDDVGGRDKKWEITPGLNFYLSRSHKWKIQFSYSFIRDEDTDNNQIDENVLRAQLQMYF
jgi:hypothetical protein